MGKSLELKLSILELKHLNQFLSSHNSSLSELLSSRTIVNGNTAAVCLGVAEAEQIRDCLTMLLAEVGFDENYSPNGQGQMLENLINLLYVP